MYVGRCVGGWVGMHACVNAINNKINYEKKKNEKKKIAIVIKNDEMAQHYQPGKLE